MKLCYHLCVVLAIAPAAALLAGGAPGSPGIDRRADLRTEKGPGALASSSSQDSRSPSEAAPRSPRKPKQPKRAVAGTSRGSTVSAFAGRHADLGTRINSANADQLQLKWKIDTSSPVSHAPLVEDGYVYFSDWDGHVYKADAGTGDLVWKRQIVEDPHKDWPWHGLAGTGFLAGGTLFEASTEGVAYAIDTETGHVRWKTRFTSDPDAGSIGRLLCHKNLLYIGLESVEEPLSTRPGFEVNFQGKVVALDARTGTLKWERGLVAPPGTGVAVRSGFALDPELDTLFFTTGNNYVGEVTPLSVAMIAVKAATGRITWSTQARDVPVPGQPSSAGDDFAGTPQLFEATIDGKRRQLVGAGQKAGYYCVFDRMSGDVVWKTPIGSGPGGGGMHGEASIGDGRIYAWSNNGYLNLRPPDDHRITIKALEAATGRVLWVREDAQPASLTAGFLANDVYFVGSLDGRVRAWQASDGKLIWTSDDHGPVTSALVASGDSLYFGTGTPALFGDWAHGTNGVAAYAVVPVVGPEANRSRLGMNWHPADEDGRPLEPALHHSP